MTRFTADTVLIYADKTETTFGEMQDATSNRILTAEVKGCDYFVLVHEGRGLIGCDKDGYFDSGDLVSKRYDCRRRAMIARADLIERFGC